MNLRSGKRESWIEENLKKYLSWFIRMIGLIQVWWIQKSFVKQYSQGCGPKSEVIQLPKIHVLLLEYEPRHEKTCFSPTRTTKVQISLRIRTVWSAPLLFAT